MGPGTRDSEYVGAAANAAPIGPGGATSASPEAPPQHVSPPSAYALSMENIHKSFGPVRANDGVNFSVAAGEIHCLLGENGAGKTTLMNILAGIYMPDAGTMRIHGREVAPRNARDAIALGIGMVHQHFMLVDRLTVTENLIAGIEPVRRGLIDRTEAVRQVRAVSERYGLRIDPHARIEDLSVGEQQRVEILKVLMRQARIIVFDEPTAVLSPQEVDELLRIMRQLQADGKTIIFITHKLKETMNFSDRVTVLRAGLHVGTMRTAATTPEQLAELMVGRKIARRAPREQVSTGPVLLRLQNVSLPGRLHGIDLAVHGGEIVGVAGVEGNGQLELEEVIAGLRPPTTGTITLNGADCQDAGPRQRRRFGLAHIPSDRLRRALAPGLPVSHNAILGYHSNLPYAKRGLLRTRSIRSHADELLRRFDVRGSTGMSAGGLSGGNQQKLVVGRELHSRPPVILACQPTRGVDIGAIEQVHSELLRARAEGSAIVLMSADLDELLALSDRLIVLYEGAIVATGATGEFTPTRLGLLMAGRGTEAAARG